MNGLLFAQLERRIPEILAAAVCERASITPVWTCAAPGERAGAAPSPPPPADDPAWHPLGIGQRWGIAPGDAPAYEPPRLDWEINPTGGSTHWLRFRLQVPPAWQGQSVHLALHWVGNRLDQVESIVYLDGAATAGLDWGHRMALLPAEAHARNGELLIRCAVAFPQSFGGVELQRRDETIFRLGHIMQTLLDAVRTLVVELPARHATSAAVARAYRALDMREGCRCAEFLGGKAARPRATAGHQPYARRQRPRSPRRSLAVTALARRPEGRPYHRQRAPDHGALPRHFSMSQPQVYAFLLSLLLRGPARPELAQPACREA